MVEGSAKVARPVVQCRGVLVSCGTICAYIDIFRNYDTSYPCVDVNTNITLTFAPPQQPDLDLSARFNYTPSYFDSHQIFQARDEVKIADMSRIFDKSPEHVWGVGILTLFASLFGLCSCFSPRLR